MPSKYILNINPNISAERPTKAEPNITPVKVMLDTLYILTGIGSKKCFADCRFTMSITLKIQK